MAVGVKRSVGLKMRPKTGFNEPISLKMTGLPDGWKATEGLIEPDQTNCDLLITPDHSNSNVYYNIQLYPKVDQYTGFLNYMRRPLKPVYAYTVVGRSITYLPQQSIQLEWRTNDINIILLKALSSIGINLSDQQVMQFSELKSQENYQGVNHL